VAFRLISGLPTVIFLSNDPEYAEGVYRW
jgi:hypothetical protein